MPSTSTRAIVRRYLLRLLSRMRHRRLEPGPPFMAPHKFPPEIILHIAVFLDDMSLMALHQTNQDLFYTVSPTADQFLRGQKARYLAESVRLTNRDNKKLLGFCTLCQKPRPLNSFSISEVMALERLEDANCLLHAQFWTCPHQGFTYTYEEPRAFNFNHINPLGLSTCKKTRCNLVFHHSYRFSSSGPFLDDHIKNEVAISRVAHQGGLRTIRDTIQRHLTKNRLQTVINMIHAPVCDHYLLSDEEVRKNFDPADLDLDDREWSSVRVPREEARIIRRSDNSCSYCQALGVRTEFRFLARTSRGPTNPGMVSIWLYAVVIRTFRLNQIGLKQPEEKHWRCHGVSERMLARFQDTWTLISNDVPRVYPVDSPAGSRSPRTKQLAGKPNG
jgi:hypothetical protein